MSEWTKMEHTVGNQQPEDPDSQAVSTGETPEREPSGSNAHTHEREPGDISADEEPWSNHGWEKSEITPRSPQRYTAGGRRKGRHKFAAPIGLCVILLAMVGIVSLVKYGIEAIERSQDDTALRTEISEFLAPVIQFTPSAFSDVNESKQDALILAAIWRLTDAERIRELKDNTSVSVYELDDMSRYLIPVSEVEASYAVLFGSDAVPYHHSIGDDGKSFTTQYDAASGYYHVPLISSSMYVSVMDTLKQKGDTVTVRIGYVVYSNIGRDDKGELVDPTPEDAAYFQLYTVERVNDTGWKLISVADEKSTGTTAAETTAATTTTTAASTASAS